MKESVQAALSWVRANAAALGLSGPSLSAAEIHLHVPAGAVPKDGPSAGVALATALVSALSGRRARGTVAMTGEISLRGRLLPVGGIKGKVMAAARAGIQTVVLPRRNAKDLVDVPEEIREKLEIRLADSIEEVLAIALEACDPCLVRAGPRLVPRDIDVMRDLVAVDGVGAGIGEHAPEQFDSLLRRSDRPRRLFAVAARVDHEHPPVRRVVDEAGRVRAEIIGLFASRDIFVDDRDQFPGPDQARARGIVTHGESSSVPAFGGKA
jgi:hypothetical protein